MRLMVTMMMTAALCAGLVGCGSAQKANGGASGAASAMASEEAIAADTVMLTVHGMGCPLCANNVDKQLKDLPGVRDVDVDMGSGRVTVHLADENRPSQAQLARAIRQSGFTLVRIDIP
jgi:copper chaperone